MLFRRKKYRYLLAIMMIAGILSPLAAQTVRAKITLSSERLLPQDRELLNELPRQLEDYVNNYDWTGENKNIIIDCRINFVIETVTTRGSEKIFRGQFQITSKAGENYLDRAFEFPDQTGQFMEHQRAIFNPLLSLIDYYVYMVIAGELDTYIRLGGSQYLDKARVVTDEGQISNFSVGWRKRGEEVRLVSDGDHVNLREAKFYYYEGLFYIEERDDALRAPSYSAKVVELLDKIYSKKPNSVALKRFLDAHYQEFCTLFTYDRDRENINAMMRIDNRRSETYEACASGNERRRRP